MLGQSLPCPKCQGLIQIPSIPPTPILRPVPQVVNLAALTKVGDPAWDEMLANETFLTPSESDADPTVRFRPMEDAIPLSSTFASRETPLTPMELPTAAPLSSQAWQSSNVAKRRQLLTIIMIAITGSLFAMAGFYAFTQWIGSPNKIHVALNPNVKSPDANQPENTEREPTPTDKPKVEEEPSASTPELVSPPITTPPTEAPQPVEPGMTEPGLSEINPSTVKPEKEEPASFDQGPQASKEDPTSSPKKTPRAEESDINDEAIPPFLKSLSDWVSPSSVLPDAGFGKNTQESELDVQNADIDLDQVFHPLPREVPSWEERAKQQFPSFKMNQTSAIRCIDLLSKMSGVGITVDWQSCQVAGIDLNAQFELDEKDKTVGELLELLMERLQLEMVFDRYGLPILKAKPAAMDANLPKDWSVAGLFVGSDKSAESEQNAAETLIQLWGFDDICSYSEGKIQWTDQATGIDKGNMLASLCELDLLRKNGPESPWQAAKFPNLLFAPTEWQASGERLKRKVGMSTIVPERTTISDIFNIAANQVELNVLFDWEHVWQHGLVPNELVVSVLRGRTFPQIANRFVSDYSIELVPISRDTIWITTGDVRRKTIRVLPIRLPKDFKLDDLKQSLRILAPLGPDDRSRFRVAPIPGSDDLFFARVCSPRADQLTDSDVVLSFGWPSE